MTGKEAIDILSDFSKQITVKGDGVYEKDVSVEAKKLAIWALSKQIITSVVRKEEISGIHKGITFPHCPYCDKWFPIGHRQVFCDRCGQAISWEVDE